MPADISQSDKFGLIPGRLQRPGSVLPLLKLFQTGRFVDSASQVRSGPVRETCTVCTVCTVGGVQASVHSYSVWADQHAGHSSQAN